MTGTPLAVECPECGTPLDSSRVLDFQVETVYVAAGTDASADVPVFTVSCHGCLAALDVRDFGGWSVSAVRAKGPVATRLRERLVDAERRGALEAEVAKILGGSTPVEALLLGTPEIHADIAPAFAPACVLAKDARARPPELVPSQAPFTFVAPLILYEADRTSDRTHRAFPAGTPLTPLGIHGGRLLCLAPDATRVAVAWPLVTR